jgi:hypothetical protein
MPLAKLIRFCVYLYQFGFHVRGRNSEDIFMASCHWVRRGVRVAKPSILLLWAFLCCLIRLQAFSLNRE